MKNESSYSKQLTSYLGKVNSSSVSKLTTEQVKEVFLLARKDFVKNKLSFDDFSDVCNCLWFNAIEGKDKGTPFASMLQNTAELNYYARKADNEESAHIVAVNLKNALAFE